MLQSRENVLILCMLEVLPQQDRTTSHGRGFSKGSAGLLCLRTEAGTCPLYSNGAGCDRQGCISGGGVD
eukprot:12534404-Ditylum_brightwellii.AAC.1